jgi:Na+-driven multidrug efflux pump
MGIFVSNRVSYLIGVREMDAAKNLFVFMAVTMAISSVTFGALIFIFRENISDFYAPND